VVRPGTCPEPTVWVGELGVPDVALVVPGTGAVGSGRADGSPAGLMAGVAAGLTAGVGFDGPGLGTAGWLGPAGA